MIADSGPPTAAAGLIAPATARAEIDLAAFRANIAELAAVADGAQLMVVVKANAYGHGLLHCARAARLAGRPGWGRRHRAKRSGSGKRATPAGCSPGCTARTRTSLLWSQPRSTSRPRPSIRSAHWSPPRASPGVRPGSSSRSTPGCPATAQQPRSGPRSARRRSAAQRAGAVEVVGLWSHLAAADEPGHPVGRHPARELPGAPSGRLGRRASIPSSGISPTRPAL